MLVASACAGGGDTDSLTLDSLPAADRAHFETWKAQVIKDCAWEQAFPSLASAFPGPSYTARALVDLDALRAAQGGPVLAATDGRFAMLGAAPPEAGFEHDDLHAQASFGGHDSTIDVLADRDDGICVITLGGEEVFHRALPRAVPVIASYDPGAARPPSVPFPVFTVATSPGTPVARFDGGPLIESTLAALAPDDVAYPVLSAQLAIPDDQARTLFPLGNAVSPDTVRVITPSGIAPFAASSFAYGSQPSVQSLDTIGSGPVEVELLYGGLGSGPDAGLVALRAQLKLAIIVGGGTMHVTSIARADRVAYDDAAVRSCFLDRGVASRFEATQPRSPAFDDQFAGCPSLASDGYAALAGDPVTRQMVASQAIAPGVTPDAYRGWDHALIEVAVRMTGAGVALSELDPRGALTHLPGILGRLNVLRGALTDPAHQTQVARGAIELAFGWFFRGQQPSDSVVASIAAALRNSATDYPTSSVTMLSDLGRDLGPTGPGMQAVQCATGITGDRRAQLTRTFAAVDQVPFASSFASDRRGNVLQTCPTSDDLTQLAAAAEAAQAFITADRARAGDSPTFAHNAEAMIAHVLTERWTSDAFRTLGDLIGFSGASPKHLFCAGYASWTERALCVDPQLALFSTGSHGILAPGVAARYAAMARELTQRWPALDNLGFINVESSISSAWDAGLWRGCSDTGFASAKQRLYRLLDMLPGATTQIFEIGDQIDALVKSQSCS